MALTINLTNLHIFNGATDLGHVVDVVRNETADPSVVKSVLDLAWIAKGELINDKTREVAALQSKLDEGLA